jgi:hypothetical protein
LAVAAERSPDRFQISPVLKCDRKCYAAVARGGISRAVGFVTAQKQLADRSIGKTADGYNVTEASNLDLKAFSGPTARQAIADIHRRTFASSATHTRHGSSTIASALSRRRKRQSYSPSHFSSVTNPAPDWRDFTSNERPLLCAEGVDVEVVTASSETISPAERVALCVNA